MGKVTGITVAVKGMVVSVYWSLVRVVGPLFSEGQLNVLFVVGAILSPS